MNLAQIAAQEKFLKEKAKVLQRQDHIIKALETDIFNLGQKQDENYTSADDRVTKIEGSLITYSRKIAAVETFDLLKADFKLVYEVGDRIDQLDRATPSLAAHQVLTRNVE